MNPARLRRILEAFKEACGLTGLEREARLDRSCGEDSELRREVSDLLDRDDREGPPGEDARFDAAAGEEADERPETGRRPVTTAWPDDVRTLAGYRLIRRIGEGAMGLVFEAEQARPRRRVALKILRPGIVSAASLRRFEKETEALGRMSHPGIAQVYEGGMAETPLGPLPFLAMELVDGQPLHRFAEKRALSIEDRVRLMIAICEAVEHAHRHDVLHRDLKPANILVDDAGRPHIIDFGLARAAASGTIEQRGSQAHSDQVVGTLPYMSPEQITGNARDLDARSDVYALGVLLHELLTGRLPIDFEGLTLPQAILRMGREQDAPRVRRVLGLPQVLEKIIGKCLENDRRLRYSSAGDLASDLQRYLAGEPVNAGHAGVRESFRRSWFRYRRRIRAASWILGGAALVAAALFLKSAGGPSVEDQRRQVLEALTLLVDKVENRDGERRPAAETKRDLREIRKLIVRQIATGPKSIEIRRLEARVLAGLGSTELSNGRLAEAWNLQKAALELREHLASAAPADRVLQRDLAVSLVKVGDLHKEIGDYGRAQDRYLRAHEILERLQSAEPGAAQALDDLSWSCERLGVVARALGDLDQSASWLHRRHEIAVGMARVRPDDAGVLHNLYCSHMLLADHFGNVGPASRGAEHTAEAVVLAQKLVAIEPWKTRSLNALQVALAAHGHRALRDADLDRALSCFQEARRFAEELEKTDPLNPCFANALAEAESGIGRTELRLGRPGPALARFRSARDLAARAGAFEPHRWEPWHCLIFAALRVVPLSRQVEGERAAAGHAWILHRLLEALMESRPGEDSIMLLAEVLKDEDLGPYRDLGAAEQALLAIAGPAFDHRVEALYLLTDVYRAQGDRSRWIDTLTAIREFLPTGRSGLRDCVEAELAEARR